MRTRLFSNVIRGCLLAAGILFFNTALEAQEFWSFGKPKREATSVERLASRIDKLEKHIDWYGSVVAKKPDVWGESRLTRHRREFEVQLAKQLEKFELSINASLSRSDQAFMANATTLGMAVSGPQAAAYPQASNGGSAQAIAIPNPTSATDALSDAGSVIKRSDGAKSLIGFKGTDKKGIALEPTVGLDQLKRYLDHLHQIRRTNEGDDIGDSPGYTINLVRIPVSILPGQKTRTGFGAEISITATPHLSEDTLPRTFRRWVINDVVDEFSLLLLKINESFESLEAMSEAFMDESDSMARRYDGWFLKGMPRTRRARYGVPNTIRNTVYNTAFILDENSTAFEDMHEVERIKPMVFAMRVFLERDDGSIDAATAMPKAREFLRAELEGAYDYLSLPENAALWDLTQRIPAAIRGANDLELKRIQRVFGYHIGSGDNRNRSYRTDRHSFRIQEELAWLILVEASLLNEQLKDDVRRVSAASNCCNVAPDEFAQFHLPPSLLTPSAIHAFNEYVKCRWPIKAFAIDPVTQDQNVADKFSMRREMQLAASVAFASGQMNAENFSQFARRIELDTETIALNRTAVGFSHGDDTFGWRFQPRFQSPEIVGTFGALRQTVFGGPSRDSILKDHRLEAGQRECVAILITPAFIPYVTFDTRTNWFRLNDPNRRQFDLQDTVKLGRDIVSLRQEKSACVKEQHLHRQGEVYRLMRSVDQLESRLPLQTSYVAMPVHDTEGGFQALAGGTTSLGPELYGFYGGVGVTGPPDTTSVLFLVGNNFSVHDTKVLAGGRALPDDDVYMLSRELLKVSIPNDASPTANGYVNVQVATPYGVAELDIPFAPQDAPQEAPAQAASNAVRIAVPLEPVGYTWKTNPRLSAQVTVRGKQIARFTLDQTSKQQKLIPTDESQGDVFASLQPSIRLASHTAEPPSIRTADLAFQMTLFKADGQALGGPINLGFWPVTLDRPISVETVCENIEYHLTRGEPDLALAKRLVLQGYLRFREGSQFRTERMQSVLSIDLDRPSSP